MRRIPVTISKHQTTERIAQQSLKGYLLSRWQLQHGCPWDSLLRRACCQCVSYQCADVSVCDVCGTDHSVSVSVGVGTVKRSRARG